MKKGFNFVNGSDSTPTVLRKKKKKKGYEAEPGSKSLLRVK